MRAIAPMMVGLALCAAFAHPEPSRVRAAPLLLDDAAALLDLEEHGFAFADVVGPTRLHAIESVVEADMREFTAGAPKDSPRRPFDPKWLGRGHFELAGVVNRIDRRAFDPTTCGEVRLVYRLALRNPKRPPTRLPMTVNVRIPQPSIDGDCTAVAQHWLERRSAASMLRALPTWTKLELNFQSIHVPGAQKDMDDSAEYVLRAFRREGDGLVVDRLFNTPRRDLAPSERDALLVWIGEHLDAIDRGAAVLPDAFLATRVVSVSPRGLARPENRPYAALFDASAFASFSFESRMMVKTPELLLRRLDEATCTGCHQTRGIAGFHLFGEERSRSTFNTLAIGHSPHLGSDLHWRDTDLEVATRGAAAPPRPFAAYPNGAYGSDCGLTPGLAEWACAPGLVCRNVHGGDVGICAPPSGANPGEPCEDVTIKPAVRAEGPVVTAGAPDATCPAPTGAMRDGGAFCAPNWLGFTGGMCSTRCAKSGEEHGRAICAPLPAAGYEADCFLSDEPIEVCLDRHLVTALVQRCDAKTSCRDDYGCARVPGGRPGVGACVPPYFLFQARVDGPRLDR